MSSKSELPLEGFEFLTSVLLGRTFAGFKTRAYLALAAATSLDGFSGRLRWPLDIEFRLNEPAIGVVLILTGMLAFLVLADLSERNLRRRHSEKLMRHVTNSNDSEAFRLEVMKHFKDWL